MTDKLAWKFKVGDKVRLTGASWWNILDGSDSHTVLTVDEDGAAILKDGWGICSGGWEAELWTEPKAEVNHPAHYNHGGIEAIDVIEAWDLGFHLGNALKYISRAGHKSLETQEQDIEKAIWYLQRFLSSGDAE